MCKAKRYFINQPSTLQPHHKLHGAKVIGIRERDSVIRIYFIEGDVISMQVQSNVLSELDPGLLKGGI